MDPVTQFARASLGAFVFYDVLLLGLHESVQQTVFGFHIEYTSQN